MTGWYNSIVRLKGDSVGSRTRSWVCGHFMCIGTNDGIQIPIILLPSLVSLVALVSQASPQLLQESKFVTHLDTYREQAL